MALLVFAAGLLGASALAWTGRWRTWTRRVLTGPLPGLGAPMGLAATFFVVSVPLLVLYLWAPSWWGPRWLKDERRDGIQPDLADPATALSYAGLTRAPGGASSSAVVAEQFGDREPLERWNATWIEHEEGSGGGSPRRSRDHELAAAHEHDGPASGTDRPSQIARAVEAAYRPKDEAMPCSVSS